MKKQVDIDTTLNVLDKIETVKVNTLFKDRVLDKINQEKEENSLFVWFNSKLQLAAMIIVLLVNTFVIVHVFNIEKTSNVQNFAKEFGLSTQEIYTIN